MSFGIRVPNLDPRQQKQQQVVRQWVVVLMVQVEDCFDKWKWSQPFVVVVVVVVGNLVPNQAPQVVMVVVMGYVVVQVHFPMMLMKSSRRTMMN